MTGERIIIADFTREMARIGVTYGEELAVSIPNEFVFPLRAAIRGTEAELLVIAGDELGDIRRNTNTLVFNRLHTLLPRMEDMELQSYLTSALWSALCQSLSLAKVIDPEQRNIGFVILPYLSSRPQLENLRTACAGERRILLSGFAHEAAALIVGFLRSAIFKVSEDNFHTSGTVCLVVAYDEQDIDVACFDYAKESAARHHILVRDFFRTSSAELSVRFAGSDWRNDLSLLLSVEAASMTKEAGIGLMKALQPLVGSASQRRYQTQGTRKLKIKGGAYIAQCCLGHGRATDEYDLSMIYHVGIQLNQKAFHPLLTKNKMARIEDYPHQSVQPFTIRGEPGQELRLNLLCGYSDQVSESTLLGHATLAGQDLADITRAEGALMMTALKFDAPGSGEFILGLLPDNKTIARRPFILPGLVM